MRHLGVPEDEVEEKAKMFWNSSPTGELLHVFVARDILKEAGLL